MEASKPHHVKLTNNCGKIIATFLIFPLSSITGLLGFFLIKYFCLPMTGKRKFKKKGLKHAVL